MIPGSIQENGGDGQLLDEHARNLPYTEALPPYRHKPTDTVKYLTGYAVDALFPLIFFAF